MKTYDLVTALAPGGFFDAQFISQFPKSWQFQFLSFIGHKKGHIYCNKYFGVAPRFKGQR